MKILVVDDEKVIVKALKFNLEQEGYEVETAFDGEEAIRLAHDETIDLILLDLMLPKVDGFTVCRTIRGFSNVPIIMLTAREDEVDKVLGLEFGADDYMTKPYSARELSARVKALLRRAEMRTQTSDTKGPANIIVSGDVTINVDRYEVKKNGKIIDITLREFELLKFLAEEPDQIFSREVLLENVWGYEYLGDVRTVDVTIRRLREKIEDDPSLPKYIMTKRSIGYYFNKL